MSKNQKQDLRKVFCSQRLLNLQKMRAAKAAKAAEKKKNVELEPKVEVKTPEPVIPNVPNQEEEISEDEVPVANPKTRKKMTSPNQALYGLQEEIQKIVQNSLPPELRKESLKQRKWEMRKEEIKKEILQSLQPSTTTPQPSKEPQKNAKSALQNIDDLFW